MDVFEVPVTPCDLHLNPRIRDILTPEAREDYERRLSDARQGSWPATSLIYPAPPCYDLDAWKHLDWTVEASGWRLAIVGGVMVGLEATR